MPVLWGLFWLPEHKNCSFFILCEMIAVWHLSLGLPGRQVGLEQFVGEVSPSLPWVLLLLWLQLLCDTLAELSTPQMTTIR